MNEDLRNWFRDKWVRMNTKGDIIGDCARDEGEGKPKCLPIAKARAMDKEDRASAAMRKRREDPVADRAGKGNKPINVATEEVSTSDLIKKSQSKRGAPGTLKAKIQGPLTLAKVRSLKNRVNATTLDKKQANFYINMQSEEYLEEKNVPTNPALWARAKTLARSKFDVYPSAYANGWAAKWYKGKGGSWKSVQEGRKMKTLKDILSEGVTVSSDFKLVNSVNAQGKPITRIVRAHRKTMNPQKNESEEKPDVLTSIQKFVGRQYDEEVVAEEGVGTHRPKETPGSWKPAGYERGTHWAQHTGTRKLKGFASSAERRAWLKANKQDVGEEVEQVDELKKSTLGSYIKKAARDKSDIDSSIGDDDQWDNMSDKEQEKSLRQSRTRKKGIDKATNKLTKEEVEQVNELKSSTLMSYLQKVSDQSQKHKMDPTKRSAEKRNKSVTGFSRAFNKLETRKEEFEQIDEISKELTHSYFVKSVDDKSKGKRKQRMSGQGRAVRRLTNKLTLPDQVSKEYANNKPGQYVGDSYEPQGQMVEGQSASIRMFKALQKAKQQRETEEARKKENEKRALTPKKTNEAKDPREYDYEGDMAKTQLRSIIANSQAVHDMLKDTTNLAEWVQSKITKAEDYISTVADYMTAEMNEGYVAEAKEDDDEDYTKHHKLDPDSGVEADQHIHVQLKKAIDSTMKPYEVSFKNGKKHTVSSPVAKTIVTAIEKLKPEHRKFAHDELHKSYDSLMAVHKAIAGK
jgi:hypothetical protein